MIRARRATGAAAVVVALALPGLAGCTLFSPAESEPTSALLEKMPAELPRRAAGPATLLVFAPDTGRAYDTTQMAYIVRPYEIAYFARHQWGGTPSQMLHPLLVRALERTGRFAAVLTPPAAGAGRHAYALRTEIRELVQDFTSQPAAVRLSLRVRLSDRAAGRVLAARDISVREPMQAQTPYAGIVAANEAAAKALQQVAGFVLENAD